MTDTCFVYCITRNFISNCMVKKMRLRVKFGLKIAYFSYREKEDYRGGWERTWFGPRLAFRMIRWKVRWGIGEQGMSDRRKSGMSCPPLRPCRLSSCFSLPNYNLICGWRHLTIHTRACKMTSTAVWQCITCLEGQQGSLSFNNMQGMGAFMTHVMGIIMAHGPVWDSLFLFHFRWCLTGSSERDVWLLSLVYSFIAFFVVTLSDHATSRYKG